MLRLGVVGESPRRERFIFAKEGLQIFEQQRQFRQSETALHRLPIQPPDDAIGVVLPVDGGEMGGDERRIAPIEQTRRQSVMLRQHQQLPLIHW